MCGAAGEGPEEPDAIWGYPRLRSVARRVAAVLVILAAVGAITAVVITQRQPEPKGSLTEVSN